MRHALLAIILLIGAATSTKGVLTAQAQTTDEAAQKAADRRAGPISGRVVNESGQPVPNAIVNIFGSSKQPARRTTNTDEDGKFRVDDLPRGAYSVLAQARGYVLARDARAPVYYRPGDSVNLVVRKGGVITGRVTNSAGEPVVGVRVRAIAHRDPDGRPGQVLGSGVPSYTDDRGVYRLFSLAPGFYLVSAGGTLPGWFGLLSPFDEDVPTYYPSSTRDTAAEIEVRAGSEATGVDIRYRSERGYAISGFITGGTTTGSRLAGVGISMVRAASGTLEVPASFQARGNEFSFGFYGVAEGEYFLVAQRYPYQNNDGARSQPVRVKVKDQDVTGVAISLVPLGSVAGRVILDPVAQEKDLKCEAKRLPSIEETLVSARRDQKEDPTEQPLSALNPNMMGAAADNGEFQIQGLDAGHYRIETRMLDEAWYVRAIELPGTGRTATKLNAGRNGFAVKSGERVNGLTVVLAGGAASLRGRVVAENGSSLPDRLRVHLVPSEQQAADDTLLFSEAAVQSDGSFTFNNLAPGRYFLAARQAPDEGAKERFPRPLVWNPNSRANLRAEAEASNIAVELKPCQRVTDFELGYSPLPKEAPKAKRP